MSDTPNFGFHRLPRFSANHLAEYLTTTNASQREAVIRKAKFPRKAPLVAYSQAVPDMGKFLASNSGDLSFFDDRLARLSDKVRREEGYNKDEAARCILALEAFKEAFVTAKVGKLRFTHGPQDVTFKIGDVRVNVRLDAPITEEKPDGQLFSGGCVLFVANTPEARKKIEERQRIVAALIHWGLQESASQVEPLSRLCIALDAFGRAATKAPTAIERLRTNITSSCREVAACWDKIAPPAGYDGPDWD